MTAKFIPNPTYWRHTGYNYQQMLAWIPPWSFLGLSQKWFYVNPDRLNTSYETELVRAMQEGLPIEPLYLRLADAIIIKEPRMGGHIRIIGANPNVHVDDFEHEGRNRASIAARLHIEFVPVAFMIPPLKNWFQGYEIFDAIWEKPKVEADILRYLGVNNFKLEDKGP